MIITLTFKTPDVVFNAIGYSEIDRSDVTAIYKACADWVRDGEYLTVEINTVTGTCTPVSAR